MNEIKNIVPFQLALSDKKQKLNFINVNNYSAGNFSLNPEFTGKRKDVFGEYIQVQADTLDSWIEKNKLKKIDFIKLDVEGSELQVLKGAKNVLKKYKPIMVMEFNSYCYILFQNKTPMDALDEIFSYFERIYKVNKMDSTLERIPNTEKAKNDFVESSLRNGFVDDLICLPRGRTLPAQDIPYSYQVLQRENARLHGDLRRILDSRSWKIASFMQDTKKLFSRLIKK
jgi:FkbM family methyltransferase